MQTINTGYFTARVWTETRDGQAALARMKAIGRAVPGTRGSRRRPSEVVVQTMVDKSEDVGEAGDGGRDKQVVSALARGLEILRAFRRGDATLGNQDLALRTNLPKPTVSRLTSTLCELGYLDLDRRTGAYSLGHGVMALGFTVMAGLDLRWRARAALEELATTFGGTAGLAVRDRAESVTLEVVHGPAALTIQIDVGGRLPAETSAQGLAILGGLSADARRDAVAEIVETRPDAADGLAERVEAAAQELRRDGFVTVISGWDRHVSGVGAPILSADARRLFSISCGGPSTVFTKELLRDRLGPQTAAAARRLSAPMET